MQWQSFMQQVHLKLKSTCSSKDAYKSKNEAEVMKVVLSNPDIGILMTEWLQEQKKSWIKKSKEKAKEAREKANNYFKRREYLKSVHAYTECAKQAPGDSEEFSVALANRSAALFHLSRYEECLEDIAGAIQARYPKRLMHKVYIRATQCHLKLKNPESANVSINKAKDFIKDNETLPASKKKDLWEQISTLSGQINEDLEVSKTKKKRPNEAEVTPEQLLEKNTNFPSASPALEQKSTSEKGRFIVAKAPIKKGDTLFVEKPFAFVPLDHADSSIVCPHCCGFQSETSLPCRGCMELSYCSPRCWSLSWPSYHKWECPGYQMGIWRQIGIAHLALKVLLISASTTEIFRFNQVQKLVTNIDKQSDDDLMVYSITALMLTQYLESHTDFLDNVDLDAKLIRKFSDKEPGIPFDVGNKNSKKLFLGSLLLRHMLQLIANGHAITRLNLINAEKENVVEEQQERVAVGIYPSVSMMNHSCDPTILNTFWNDTLIVKATKDIPAGGEIFNCYGPHFRRMPVRERQKVLKSQYCFRCKCEACTDPDLRCFLDRFSALKCPKCSGPLKASDGKLHKCLDCETSTSIDVDEQSKILQRARVLFESSQNCLSMGKDEEAHKKLSECLEIREKFLFKHHEDVAITLDALGKVNVILGHWLISISYLERSILVVEDKFGPDSIEVANELNKITDVCLQYLQKDTNRRSTQYKNVLEKTQKFLDRAEEITNLISGPWSTVCQELQDKKEELSGLLEILHI